MFDLGWGELLLIGVVALVVIGPKELPGVLRSLGVWIGKIRRMATEFQGQFQEAMREAELSDLRKPLDDLNTIKDYNPFSAVQSEFERSVGDIGSAVDPAPPAPAAVVDPPAIAPQALAMDPPAITPPAVEMAAALPPPDDAPPVVGVQDADKRP